MIYVLLALIVIIPSLILNINKSKSAQKKYLVITFGCMTILAALRKHTIGIDLETIYYPIFELIKNTSFENLNIVGIEFGFAFFMKLITNFSDNYQTFTIITSLITFPIFGYFIYKNSEDVGLSTILFLLTANFFMELNVVRQACAMAFIMLAYEEYKKNKKIIFLILSFIAISFHTAAIIFLFIPFFNKIKLNNKFIILSFIFSIIFIVFLPQIVEYGGNFLYNLGFSSNKNYALYINSKHGTSHIDLFSISEVIISLMIFLVGMYSTKIADKNETRISQANYQVLLLSSFFYFLFNFLALRMSVIRRLALFFIPFAYSLLPDAMKIMKNKQNKGIIYLTVIIFIGARYIYMLFGLAESLFGVLPYQFFWE